MTTTTDDHAATCKGPAPCGVTFHPATLRRVGCTGDNWCQTWAADGSIWTSMDDGDWLHGQRGYNNHLYRLDGAVDDFTPQDVPGYPRFVFNEGGWFGYGLCSLDGALYSFVSKCPKSSWSGPFQGIKLLKSADNGQSWCRVDREGRERPLAPWDPARYAVDEAEMFFWRESGREAHGGVAYPFGSCAIAQRGRDGQADDDGYAYVYSPEGANTHELLLARAPRQTLGQRESWTFFAGRSGDAPIWSPDLEARRPMYIFPQQDTRGDVYGWYSWLPSVVWNEGLGLYIMVNGGTFGGHGLTSDAEDYYHAWMHTRSGSLGLWYARHPWGPWTQFFDDEEWTVDSPDNRTYQPKLSPKWISADGREMVLIWSDAMKNSAGRSHSVNYKWNQMAITIEVTDVS